MNFGYTGDFEYEDPWDTWCSWDVSALWNDEETLWNEDWSWSDATWHDCIWDWSHSQQTLVEPTVSSQAGNLTSATSSEPRASALGPLDTGRVAAVISEPPGLLRPSPKAKAPSGTSLASNLLMSAVVFGSFGLGTSLRTERLGGEDMMTGVVDFTCGCLKSPWLTWNRSGLDTTCLDDLPVDLPVAPLETFRLDALESSRRVTFSCVEDLNLKVNTELHDVYLQEQVAAVWQQDEPWILFDSGAAARCFPKGFALDWPLLPLSGKAPPLKSISGQPLLIYGRRNTSLRQQELAAPKRYCLR